MNATDILPATTKVKQKKTKIDAEAIAALRNFGLILDDIQWGSGLQRCGTQAKPRSKNGAYTAHLDSPATVWMTDWSSGEQKTWTAKPENKLTAAERKVIDARAEENRKIREAEKADRQKEAAAKAKRIYDAAVDCSEHQYLAKKGVKPVEGLRVSQGTKYDSLIIPLFEEHGEIVSLQFIAPDGQKRFLSGGRKQGCFFFVGDDDEGVPLLVVEGLATGLSLYECTGCPVLVAFDASNLKYVAEIARKRYAENEIVLCADLDDSSDTCPSFGGVGLLRATAAAVDVGGTVAIPELDGGKCDFNDVFLAKGKGAVIEQFAQRQRPEVAAEDDNDPAEGPVLPPPPPVPLEAFPADVQTMIMEISIAVGASEQMVTASFLSFVSSLIGRSRLIAAKSSWQEAANLYFAIVASSAQAKSPTQKIFQDVISRLEADEESQYSKEMQEYAIALSYYKNQLKAAAKKKPCDGHDFNLIEPRKPRRKRLLVNDATIEAALDVLSENPKGILLSFDELSGLITGFSRYTNSGPGPWKNVILSGHCLSMIRVDRSSPTSKRNYTIDKACLSIVGGIQPKMLQRIFSEEDADCGLLQRFIFVRSELQKPRLWNETTISQESLSLLDRIARKLWSWDVLRDGYGQECDIVIRLSPEAKKIFIKWFNVVSIDAFESDDENAALLSKLQAHCLRVALVLHSLTAVLTGNDGLSPISEDCMSRALKLADWIRIHQEQCWRLFAPVNKAEQIAPLERAVAAAVVGMEDTIRADKFLISTQDLYDATSRNLDIAGLSMRKISKAASRLGLTKTRIGRGKVRGFALTEKIISKLKNSGPSGPSGPTPCESKAKAGTTSKSEVVQVVRPLPAWAYDDADTLQQ